MSGRAAVVVAGASQKALNATVLAFHAATQSGCPGPFRGAVEIEAFGVKQVSWKIPNAPTIDLAPKQADRDWLKARIRNGLGTFELAEAWADSMVDESVMIGVKAAGVEVTIEVDKGASRTVSGNLSTFVQARTSADRRIVFQAQHSRFIPDGDHDAGTQWLLDHIVVPQVQKHLNAAFAGGDPFTPFPDDLVGFSAPSIAIANGALVAFATDDPHEIAAGPPALSWPADRVQGLAQLDIWQQAFTKTLKRSHLGDKFSFHFKEKPFKFEVSGYYGIYEGHVIKRLSDTSLLVEMSVGGVGAHVKIKLFSGTIYTVTLGIHARPQMRVGIKTQGGKIVPKIEKLEALNLHLDLSLPGKLEKLLDKVIDAIAKVISRRMTSLLKRINLGSAEIPSIDLGWQSVMATVSGKDLELVQQSAAKKPTWFGMSAVPIATPVPPGSMPARRSRQP